MSHVQELIDRPELAWTGAGRGDAAHELPARSSRLVPRRTPPAGDQSNPLGPDIRTDFQKNEMEIP